MHYSAIHVTKRETGNSEILKHAFHAPGDIPGEMVTAWRSLQDDPRIGERYTDVQFMADNVVRESYSNLPHPDIAEKEERHLRAAAEARAQKERTAEALQLLARLDELERQGLFPEDIGLPADPRTAELHSAPLQPATEPSTEAASGHPSPDLSPDGAPSGGSPPPPAGDGDGITNPSPETPDTMPEADAAASGAPTQADPGKRAPRLRAPGS